jgi:hypothetical protein
VLRRDAALVGVARRARVRARVGRPARRHRALGLDLVGQRGVAAGGGLELCEVPAPDHACRLEAIRARRDPDDRFPAAYRWNATAARAR